MINMNRVITEEDSHRNRQNHQYFQWKTLSFFILSGRKLRRTQKLCQRKRDRKVMKSLAENEICAFLQNTFLSARALASTEGSRGVSEWVSKKWATQLIAIDFFQFLQWVLAFLAKFGYLNINKANPWWKDGIPAHFNFVCFSFSMLLAWLTCTSE